MRGEVIVCIDNDTHTPTFHWDIRHFEWLQEGWPLPQFLIRNVTKFVLCKEHLEMTMENAYV